MTPTTVPHPPRPAMADPQSPLAGGRTRGATHLWRGSAALGWRNALTALRQPQSLVFLILQPVLFVIMFRYVFGGAITVPGFDYVNYLLPGIFAQTLLFGGISTAIALSGDIATGFLDRVRSLPVSRGAYLTGRVMADTVRNALTILVLWLVGLAVGFTPGGGVGRTLIGLGLLLAFSTAFLWVFALLGMLVRSPEGAQAASFLIVFPLVFVSSAFVPTASMPSWLRAFADNQPVTALADALRGLLLDGGAVTGTVWQSLGWSAGIAVVFAGLAVRACRAA